VTEREKCWLSRMIAFASDKFSDRRIKVRKLENMSPQNRRTETGEY